MTLRDLGEGLGGVHRMNVYFYNHWADEYSHLSPGDEVLVSGPSTRLVRVDDSAGSGDHPYCLAFYTPLDDMVPGLDTAAADVKGTSVDDIGVTFKVVEAVENVARGAPAGVDEQQRRDRRGGQADGSRRWKGTGSKPSAKQG